MVPAQVGMARSLKVTKYNQQCKSERTIIPGSFKVKESLLSVLRALFGKPASRVSNSRIIEIRDLYPDLCGTAAMRQPDASLNL